MRKKIIHNDLEKCVGCNRCVRVCPIDEANITTREDGRIIVRIDNDKCIVCSACQVACHHGSRYYEDDTESFFEDLRNGERISLITAPAMKTNFPEWGRLLSWMRRCGVEKIYDVSLGADICTWAHIRHIQKGGLSPIITQPCPAVVNYILLHKNDVLDHLSRVQSPMLCAAIYMSRYENVDTKIAALTPCAAKAHEFERTGKLVSYNVTFKHLHEYIQKHGVAFPREASGFDSIDAGLGALYPLPGGLKECVEHYVGKTLRVDRAEGPTIVYRAIDKYAEQDDSKLPALFDVLNCAEGCNSGTGCRHDVDMFEINTIMDNVRLKAIKGIDGMKRLDDLFESFDEKLSLDDFIRTYEPAQVSRIPVTREQIDKTFAALGKIDALSKNFDCGACGSYTCLEMVEKIAKGINIAQNCAEFVHREITREHETVLAGLNYAAKIQSNLLPKSRALLEGFSDYSVIWRPRDVVGGDIYWMKNFDEGTVLCVCDCTGHGTPGALLTMLVVSALEAEVKPDNCRDTANIIWQLEQRLVSVFGVGAESPRGTVIKDGCDIAAMFIANDGSAILSSGNTRVFVCDGKEVRQIRGQKIFVGEGNIRAKDEINTIHIPVNPQNKFYIASDGLFEQPGGEFSEPYGYREFKRIILENHHEKQIVISNEIWAAFEKYRGSEQRVDDFVLLTFKP